MIEPTILAFDTSGPYCAAALVQDFPRHEEHLEMAKGQVENLMPLLETVLQRSSKGWRDIELLAVGIGPGNFTGIRIAVSAARGLALSLGIPAMGISLFEVMRDPAGLGANAAEIVSLEGPRGTAYVQHFRYGKPQSDPRIIDPKNPPQDLALPLNMMVRGYKASVIARHFGCEAQPAELEDIAGRIGRCADYRWGLGETNPSRPAPLYSRAPDAAPPRDPAPKILL